MDSRTRASWIEITMLMLTQNSVSRNDFLYLGSFTYLIPGNFRGFIETAIPTLLEMMMRDTNDKVQEAGKKALTSLAEDGVFDSHIP